MKKWMTIVMVFVLMEGNAQNFYVNASGGPDYNTTYQLNINNCDSQKIYTCIPINSGGDVYNDIAIDTSQNLYYLTATGGALYTRKLNDINSCQYLGRFAGDSDMQSLACDIKGNVFSISTNGYNDSTEFYEYNPNTKTFIHLGFLPDDFGSQGDIFFYEGRLFLTAISVSRRSSVLVEVNIKDPSQSCFYMDLGQMSVYAAFSIQNGNCSDAYVFDTKGNGSTLYKLDLVNKTISQPICTYPFDVYGAASIYKFSPSIIDSSSCTNVESNCVAMPVTFLNFTSTLINNSVKLQWQTANEINSNYFSIERSANGINFNAIGKTAAAGNSGSVKEYSFIDASSPTLLLAGI